MCTYTTKVPYLPSLGNILVHLLLFRLLPFSLLLFFLKFKTVLEAKVVKSQYYYVNYVYKTSNYH